MMHIPNFPAQWQPLVDQAATTLRALALDESAKADFALRISHRRGDEFGAAAAGVEVLDPQQPPLALLPP